MVGGYTASAIKVNSTSNKNSTNKVNAIKLPTASTGNNKTNTPTLPIAVDTTYKNNTITTPIVATKPTLPTVPTTITAPVVSTTSPINLGYQNNMSQYFDSNVVKPIQSISGGGSGGVTDEGVVIGNPNVNNDTFGGNVGTGNSVKVDTSYGSNATYGANTPLKTPVTSIVSTNKGNTQTTPTATDTGKNTATETPQTETIDSYEEFLMKQGETYQANLDKTNAAIDASKQAAIELAQQQQQRTEEAAEAERQRAVIDARSSYEQNKATYGANAEMLASMGLSGSGYSDYINSQAYATQRGETQSANALAQATKQEAKYTADAAILAAEQQASSDKLAADLSYSENMAANNEKLAQYKQQKADEAAAKEEQKAEDQKQYYAALLTSANTGEYTSEQLASLGAQYGLSEEQIADLQAAADKYESDSKQETYNTTYAQALQNISDYGADLDSDYLDNLLEMDLISKTQYDSLKAKYNKAVVESDSASFNTEKIDSAYESGQITETDYETQKQAWNSNIDTSSTFFNSGSMSVSEAKALLNKTINNGWCSEETKAALQETYESCYGKIATNASLNGKANSANDDYGDNFEIKVNGSTYKVEKGYDASDNLSRKLSENYRSEKGELPPTGAVMIYGGRVYMYLENNESNTYTWCCVQARKNSYAGSFKDMCTALGLITYSRGYKDGE